MTSRGIAVLILSAVLSLLFLLSDPQNDSLEAYADEIISACESEPYRPTCYEREVIAYDSFPVSEIFSLIRMIRKADPSYTYCHVLAHEIGAREVAKDPLNWVTVLHQGPPDGLCSNGYLHGAAVERFNKEVFSDAEIERVVPDLNRACEPEGGWNPTELDKAICYHGMGHLIMHLTEADIDKSLEICDRIAVKSDGRNYQQVCDEGVFMQIFQPLEPEDYALIDKLASEPTKETLFDFCSRYPVAEGSACWREGWPLFEKEIFTNEGLKAFCEGVPYPQQKDQCYTTVFSIIGRRTIAEPEKKVELCSSMHPERMGECFAIGATTMLEEDKGNITGAVDFCAHISSEVANQCYQRLARLSGFIFHPASVERRALCEQLPNSWEEQCLQ